MKQAQTTGQHKIEEIVGVRYGVIIGCTCGWTYHAKAGYDAVMWRREARQKMAEHKRDVT